MGADMMAAGCMCRPDSDFDSYFVDCVWDCIDDSNCFEDLADSNSAAVVVAVVAAAVVATVVAATAAAAYLLDRIPAGQNNLQGAHTCYQKPYQLEVSPP